MTKLIIATLCVALRQLF